MPERPDLEYFVPILDREIKGQTITGVRVDKPVVLRVALREPMTAVVGRTGSQTWRLGGSNTVGRSSITSTINQS